jgi:hypothetical protein
MTDRNAPGADRACRPALCCTTQEEKPGNFPGFFHDISAIRVLARQSGFSHFWRNHRFVSGTAVSFSQVSGSTPTTAPGKRHDIRS